MSARTRKTPRRQPRLGGARTLADFQARLAALDDELDDAIRTTGGPGLRGRLEEQIEETAESILDPARVAGFLYALGRLATSEPADEFGLDPSLREVAEPLLLFLERVWFRVRVAGVRQVPSRGPVLLVANRSPIALPWDAAMLDAALRFHHPARRGVRPLLDHALLAMPLVGAPLARLGAVAPSTRSVRRLLDEGQAVGLFVDVAGRPRGTGIIAAAAGRGAALVPVAISGAERSSPVFGHLQWPRRLGLPPLPLTPTFPWLGLPGLLPLPGRWEIRFGAPVERSLVGRDAAAALHASLAAMLESRPATH
jgi:1-acyl-sn-glycerol-3-phosphate acyltransferase